MILQSMAPILADARSIWEIRSFRAAVASAILTALAAICTGAWAILQRRQELRWKRAKTARDMLDEIFDYKPSNDAWRMVDDEPHYKDREKNKLEITIADVRRALRIPLTDDADHHIRRKDDYVRWCFDALLYYLDRLDQSIKIGVVRIEDLRAPSSYYIEKMAKDKDLFRSYANFIRLEGAIAFMNRFQEWRGCTRSRAPDSSS